MSRRYHSLLFPFLLVFYEIATYLSNDMYLPALPEMIRDLAISTQQAQLTLTTWFLGSATTPLIAGVIADRYGRRPVLLIGGVIYIIATLICAMTNDLHVLLVARFIEGSIIPTMMVSGYASIHDLYETKEAIRILALMASISVLAPALGPLAGGILLYFASWRGIFWFVAIWSTIAILLLYRWMPETLSAHEKRQSLQLKSLLNDYWSIMTNKQFMLLMMAPGFIFCGFIVWITASPLLTITYFHYSAVIFGVIQGFIFAVYIFANQLVKFLLEKIGIQYLIWLGLLITLGGGVLLLFSALYASMQLYAFLVAMTIYALGSGLCFSPLNRAIIETSNAPMGMRVAMFTVFFEGFAALGSGIAGLFFTGTLLSLAIPIAAASLLACLFMFKSLRS